MELRVKEICKEKGLLMEELASRLGITRITLTRNINGNPTIDTLEKIASALEVNITELFAQHKNDVYGFIHANGATYTINSLDGLERLISDLQKGKPK